MLPAVALPGQGEVTLERGQERGQERGRECGRECGRERGRDHRRDHRRDPRVMNVLTKMRSGTPTRMQMVNASRATRASSAWSDLG